MRSLQVQRQEAGKLWLQVTRDRREDVQRQRVAAEPRGLNRGCGGEG